MTERTYQQRCPIARALDVVGERWGLLIVRELHLGPMRYGDLRAALPAMGTRVLADRLKELVSRDVIAATDEGYALTARGAALLPVLGALATWGEPLLAREVPGDASPPSTVALLLMSRVVALPRAGEGVFQLRIDGQPIVLTVAGVETRVKRGETSACEGEISLTVDAAIALLDERSTVAEEIERGRMTLSGLTRRRVRELFGFRLG